MPSRSAPAPDALSLLRDRATSKLLAMTEWPDEDATARLCDQADRSRLTQAIKAKCAEAHLSIAALRLKEHNVVDAHKALNAAAAYGASDKRRRKLDAAVRKIEAAQEKKRRDAEAAGAAIFRVMYAKALRERYLDQNLDIDVTVGGKNRDRITLKYVLFSDVWARKFQKGDLLEEMRKIGFRRVQISDGYDYGVYWDLHR